MRNFIKNIFATIGAFVVFSAVKEVIDDKKEDKENSKEEDSE